MKKLIPMIVILLLITTVIFMALFQSSESGQTPKPSYDCSRIITMSPSVTETVWSLQLGSKIIATDRFSSWPQQIEKLPKVGGFLDPNIEQIATLKPSIVIIPESASKTINSLEKLGIRTLSVNHATLAGVEKSFISIATVCGKKQNGEKLLHSFQTEIQTPHAAKNRPSILIVVSREMTDKGMKNIIGVGDDKLFSELITRAGATNALKGAKAYSMMQREKLLTLKPDIIVDVSLSSDEKKDVMVAWKNSGVTGKIEVVNQQWAVVPGPRMVKLIELLKMLVKT